MIWDSFPARMEGETILARIVRKREECPALTTLLHEIKIRGRPEGASTSSWTKTQRSCGSGRGSCWGSSSPSGASPPIWRHCNAQASSRTRRRPLSWRGRMLGTRRVTKQRAKSQTTWDWQHFAQRCTRRSERREERAREASCPCRPKRAMISARSAAS